MCPMMCTCGQGARAGGLPGAHRNPPCPPRTPPHLLPITLGICQDPHEPLELPCRVSGVDEEPEVGLGAEVHVEGDKAQPRPDLCRVEPAGPAWKRGVSAVSPDPQTLHPSHGPLALCHPRCPPAWSPRCPCAPTALCTLTSHDTPSLHLSLPMKLRHLHLAWYPHCPSSMENPLCPASPEPPVAQSPQL